MYKVSHRKFREAKYKQKQLKLVLVGSFFFVFGCTMSFVHLHKQWVKYLAGEDVVTEFFLTHQFVILIVFQLLFSLIFFVAIRPAYAFGNQGVYIRPGFIYSSSIYIVPWENIEKISIANRKDDDDDWVVNILIETNLESLKTPKFRVGVGTTYYDNFNFSFTINFLSFSYQKELLGILKRLHSKSKRIENIHILQAK